MKMKKIVQLELDIRINKENTTASEYESISKINRERAR